MTYLTQRRVVWLLMLAVQIGRLSTCLSATSETLDSLKTRNLYYHSNNNNNNNKFPYAPANNNDDILPFDIIAEIESLRNDSRVQELLQSTNVRIRCSCPEVSCNCGNSTAVQQSGAGDNVRCVCDCANTATTRAAVAAALSRRQTLSCPDGTFSDSTAFSPSKCYYLSTASASTLASMPDAVMQCKNMQGKLAEPQTLAEARALFNIIERTENSSSTAPIAAFWIGIVELVMPTANQLLYASGAQPVPRLLAQALRDATLQLPIDIPHDCYAISSATPAAAKWANRDCGQLLRYVCEFEPNVDVKT